VKRKFSSCWWKHLRKMKMKIMCGRYHSVDMTLNKYDILWNSSGIVQQLISILDPINFATHSVKWIKKNPWKIGTRFFYLIIYFKILFGVNRLLLNLGMCAVSRTICSFSVVSSYRWEMHFKEFIERCMDYDDSLGIVWNMSQSNRTKFPLVPPWT